MLNANHYLLTRRDLHLLSHTPLEVTTRAMCVVTTRFVIMSCSQTPRLSYKGRRARTGHAQTPPPFLLLGVGSGDETVLA